MKHFFLLIAGSVLLTPGFAQNKTFFNTAISADVSFKTTKSIALKDGNFLIAGQKGDDFEQDKQTKVLFKTDSTGKILWQHTFNTAKNTGIGVIGLTPSGEFIMAAPSIEGNNNQTVIFKTNEQGTVSATKLLSDTVSQPEISEILVSNDNKSIFIGMAKGNFPNVDNAMDIYMSKYDDAFNVLWSKIYSISDKEFYTASTLLTDGTILSGGLASSCGQGCISKAYIMTVNPSDGSHIRTKMFNSTSYTVDNLIAAADGGFFAVINDQGKETYNIVKFTKNMEVVFAKEYTSTPKLQVVTIKELNDGSLLTVTYTDLGLSILKLNAKGEVISAKNYFSRFSFNKINLFSKVNSPLITAIVNDYSQTKVFNFDADGSTGCVDSTPSFQVTASDMNLDFYTNTSPVFYNKPNIDKGPEFKDCTYKNVTSTDITVSSKLICKTTVLAVNKEVVNTGISVYPNPTNGLATIHLDELKSGVKELLLYTVYGQLVYRLDLTSKQTEINLTTMAKGMYIATIKNGTSLITNKIILQ